MDAGAQDLLKKPRSVAIFPGGKRSAFGIESVEKAYKGVITLSRKSNLPIVPVFIKGSANICGRGFDKCIAATPFVIVVVGEPMQDPDAEDVSTAINTLGNKWQDTTAGISCRDGRAGNVFYPVTFEECWDT